MTTVKILATGSDGNCIFLSTGGASILIDVGLPKTHIEKIMLRENIDSSRIDAILISHEHQDHCKGIAFADKFKVPVYASEGTLKHLKRLDSGNIIKAGAGNGIVLDALRPTFISVTAFGVHHDAMEPIGFAIQTADRKISVMMDTGRVDDEMITAMAMSDVYVLEANHDIGMLRNGPYDDFLKRRVESDNGHLSNDQAAAALAQMVRGQGEQIYLTHMSSKNNTPALAEKTVKMALFERGLVKGKHYRLEVI